MSSVRREARGASFLCWGPVEAGATFAMYGKFQARAGERDALVDVLLEAAGVVGAIPECAMYLVTTVPEDDDAVCVIEVWSSEEAHSDSLHRDDVRAVVQRGCRSSAR